ncbi:MAG: Hsp20/alpha crystallin family protein [Verrucomicrobiaceae bacterium]
MTNRIFGNLDDFLSQTLRSFGPSPATRAPGAYRYEDDEAYRLRLEIPGFNKDEVTLSVTEDTLTVKAESKDQDLSYERSLSLPETVAQDGITAKLENGILELTFPKTEPETPETRIINIA